MSNLSTMPKYDDYKDSGVDWLSDIPSHWPLISLKRVVKEHSGYGFPIDLQGDNGEIPFLKVSDISGGGFFVDRSANKVSSQTISKQRWKTVPSGSLVTAKIGEALRKNHRKLLKEDSLIDNNCIAFEPTGLDTKFSYYLHLVLDFEWFVNPGAVPSISVSKYKAEKVAVPSLSEQVAIVQFLDVKTVQLDDAIAIKEQQVALLNERKQIIIQQAVTQGLNPDAPMKDSGVEWIGEIPEHWELKRVKHLFKLEVDSSEKNNNHELLSVYSDIGVKPRRELEERGNKASTTDGYWLVKQGDIIVNKLLAWMGAIGLSEYDGVTSPAYDILRPQVPLNGWFYHYLFRAPFCSAELKRHSRGIMDMRLRLYFDKFGVIEVPYPPYEEQNEIIEHLTKTFEEIEKAIHLLNGQIDKLKEYKTTLIDAAVTGKIKVA